MDGLTDGNVTRCVGLFADDLAQVLPELEKTIRSP